MAGESLAGLNQQYLGFHQQYTTTTSGASWGGSGVGGNWITYQTPQTQITTNGIDWNQLQGQLQTQQFIGGGASGVAVLDSSKEEAGDMTISDINRAQAKSTRKENPSKVPLSFEGLADEVEREQTELARELGMSMTAINKNSMKQFLSARGWAPYAYSEVVAFLNDKYGKLPNSNWDTKPTWGWVPLRQKDLDTFPDKSWKYGTNGEKQPAAGLYKKAVPLPVLHTVRDIAKAFPDALFFVSDEVKAPEPVRDPFLMVQHEDTCYIIEQWDEPSFVGKRQ